jgi:hypothetical protein
VGEGVVNDLSQVADLVRRAQADGAGRGDVPDGPLGGPARELANDRVLMAAGILPGDPSLYPGSVADIWGRPVSEQAGN